MSNFTGVTFAQQKVLPSDDAIIRRSILSDGILYGCELSYSGSTLTMGAGQLLICGRQIRHPSAQNWAVADATSGYARLVLTVDLTRTSSKDVFEQVVDFIEYATAQDGFPELEQANVNISGSRYQVVACVVSLGPGGITDIVSQLQQSRATIPTTVQLPATAWVGNIQSVSVEGMTADNTVLVTPAPESYVVWGESVVYCSAQGEDTLTFTCDEVPMADLTANLLIMN